jgi:hypothetical protein
MIQKRALYERLAIAVMRFKDDPNNPKRLVTIENLIEELRNFNKPEDEHGED